MSQDRFPVLNQQNCHPRERKTMPASVPWTFAETFRDQAEYNHDQTLERLAERGGLSPEEMWLAAHGHRLRSVEIDEQKAINWLYEASGGVAFMIKWKEADPMKADVKDEKPIVVDTERHFYRRRRFYATLSSAIPNSFSVWEIVGGYEDGFVINRNEAEDLRDLLDEILADAELK